MQNISIWSSSLNLYYNLWTVTVALGLQSACLPQTHLVTQSRLEGKFRGFAERYRILEKLLNISVSGHLQHKNELNKSRLHHPQRNK